MWKQVPVKMRRQAQSGCVNYGHYCGNYVRYCGMTVAMQDVEEPEARAAFIWIFGEHGHAIQVHLKRPLHVILLHSQVHDSSSMLDSWP